MGMVGRLRGRLARAELARRASAADLEHLTTWAGARTGVEAFVEPRTAMTETTVVLVANDGEWTRRQVDGPAGAQKLAKSLRIPV